MHPSKKIELAIEKLERSKADLELRRDELVGYEVQYIEILAGLIAMMKSSEKNTHWFHMSGDSAWSTRDRWKLDALKLANMLIKDEDDYPRDTR